MIDLLVSVALRALIPAAAGGAVLWIGRVNSAAARHAVWAVVAASMLTSLAVVALLPPIALRVLPAAVAPRADSTVTVTVEAESVTPVVSPRPRISWEQVAAIAYAAGVVVFFFRLVLGYVFTLRLAHRARHIEDEVYEATGIATPMMMGCLRPMILLPPDWRDWNERRMQAVLAHEREHARRWDWAVAGLAAVNRCVFWFHPLAWWLERKLAALAEEACDDAVVRQTGRRAQYAEILLEMAAAVKLHRGRLDWEAMAMAKPAEVRVRIDRILDETRTISVGMSRRWRAALLACGLPVAYLAAALQVAPAVEQESKQTESKQVPPKAEPPKAVPKAEAKRAIEAPNPAAKAPAVEDYIDTLRKPADPAQERTTVTIQQPALASEPVQLLKLLKRVEPEYPKIAAQTGARGVVRMMVTIAPEGNVSNVKVVSGHPLLVNAAVEAVKQWVYTPPSMERVVEVSLNFAGVDIPQAGGGAIQQAVLISRKEPVYPEEAKRAGIKGAVVLSATIGKDGHIKAVRVIRGDPVLAPAAQEAIQQWLYKPTMLNGTPVETETQITLNFTGDNGARQPGSMDGNTFERAELISRKEPAAQAVSGTVNFRATVGLDGQLSNIRVVDAPAELVPAALDAVKQWVYRPAKLNGKPIEAETQISLRF